MFVNIAGSWLGTSLLLGTQRGISEFRVSVGQFSRSEKVGSARYFRIPKSLTR